MTVKKVTEKIARKRWLRQLATGMSILIPTVIFLDGWMVALVSVVGFCFLLQAQKWSGYAQALKESERDFATVDGIMLTIVGAVPEREKQAIYEALSERFRRVERDES